MPHTPTIKAVVFDLDGLMFNTEEVFNRSAREQLRRRGKVLTDELVARMMGRRARDAFDAMIETHGLTETFEELQRESREIFLEILPEFLAPMPGLLDLLDLLEARNLPKGVATSSARHYLEDILGRFQLLDRFPMTLTAEDVEHGKPHPEIYLTAAERIGVDPTEMLVLEDSEMGTKAGAAAGAVVVSVPHEFSRTHDFSTATYVASGLNDPKLLAMLE